MVNEKPTKIAKDSFQSKHTFMEQQSGTHKGLWAFVSNYQLCSKTKPVLKQSLLTITMNTHKLKKGLILRVSADDIRRFILTNYPQINSRGWKLEMAEVKTTLWYQPGSDSKDIRGTWRPVRCLEMKPARQKIVCTRREEGEWMYQRKDAEVGSLEEEQRGRWLAEGNQVEEEETLNDAAAAMRRRRAATAASDNLFTSIQMFNHLLLIFFNQRSGKQVVLKLLKYKMPLSSSKSIENLYCSLIFILYASFSFPCLSTNYFSWLYFLTVY